VKLLTTRDLHARKVSELGLDPSALDLTSVEAIAAALRRCAGFLCPCSPVTLVRAVVRPLRGLVDSADDTKQTVEGVLEAMIAHGDLIEQREVLDEGPEGRILVYASPPSFVPRDSGSAILLGIASDEVSGLSDDLESRIEYVAHIRRLSPVGTDDLRSERAELGLITLPYEHWLKAPVAESASKLIARSNQLLDGAQPSREIPGLRLLDPDAAVHFYPKRWVEPRRHSGRFVARRSQAYGADLWCYVELRDGQPERLVDLPVSGSCWRGCDEAWLLQMALDATRGHPQQYRLRPGPSRFQILEFFSPVPMWAQRRWNAVGELVPARSCLFAYKFPDAELEEELRFVQERLWLTEQKGGALSQ